MELIEGKIRIFLEEKIFNKMELNIGWKQINVIHDKGKNLEKEIIGIEILIWEIKEIMKKKCSN